MGVPGRGSLAPCKGQVTPRDRGHTFSLSLGGKAFRASVEATDGPGLHWGQEATKTVGWVFTWSPREGDGPWRTPDAQTLIPRGRPPLQGLSQPGCWPPTRACHSCWPSPGASGPAGPGGAWESAPLSVPWGSRGCWASGRSSEPPPVTREAEEGGSKF